MAFSKQMTENLEHFKQILQTDKNFDVITVCFEKLQVDDRVAVLEKTVQELTSMLENLRQKVVMR